MKQIPNPGTAAAVEQGCLCPVLDNNRGKGAWLDDDGVPEFWVHASCPLHNGDHLHDGTLEPK